MSAIERLFCYLPFLLLMGVGGFLAHHYHEAGHYIGLILIAAGGYLLGLAVGGESALKSTKEPVNENV